MKRVKSSYAAHKAKLVLELKRRIVSAGGSGVLVRGGKGTAYGWIEVTGGPVFGDSFTKQQVVAIKRVFGPDQHPGANFFVVQVHHLARMFKMPFPGIVMATPSSGVVKNPLVGVRRKLC